MRELKLNITVTDSKGEVVQKEVTISREQYRKGVVALKEAELDAAYKSGLTLAVMVNIVQKAAGVSRDIALAIVYDHMRLSE